MQSIFSDRDAVRRTALVAAILGAILPGTVRGQQPAAPAKAAASAPADENDGDLARKAEIMNSPRWRRAIFELGEWLSSQQIYSPQEVRNLKTDFNRRVAGMSSYELEYLLDDLDAKFKILDTPEAKDARQWVGQYLSVMSDQKRAQVLKDVPDVVSMTSAQLQQEIDKIEQTRASLQRQQSAFNEGRQQLVDRAAAARQATAAASNAAAARAQTGVSYSPYRGQSQGGGKPPFADAHGSGMSVGVGPWGAYVNFNVGNF
jgi:nucleoid-associated protein YgaU